MLKPAPRIWLLLAGCMFARAEFLTIETSISDMNCPSCTETLTNAFKRVRGVEAVDVDKEKWIVKLKLAETNRVTLEQVWDAIKRVGFTPSESRVRVRGVVGGAKLAVSHADREYSVEGAADSGGKTVEIEGSVKPPQDPRTPPKIVTEKPTADLRLRDLEGVERSLADYRGRIVVLNFWATWCGPCRAEMPLLSRIRREFAAQGLEVIGASTDDESSRARVPEFVRKLKIDFPVWTGATVADKERFGLHRELPATAILDRDGSTVWGINGVVESRDLTKRVRWLLSDRTSTRPEDPKDHHDEEGHSHAAVGIEGASSVPS